MLEIKSIETLASSLCEGGKIIIGSGCQHLLSNGENYGSIMIDLRIALETKDGETEVVNCVAKTCPPKGILWTIFNIPSTVKKEIAFYQNIVPTLNSYGKEKGIEMVMPFFAKCYGGRISLDPNADEVDNDAVLLLENVKRRGFRLCNRFMGFNMEETKLLLKDLAIFHAVPIAHKLQKPEQFKEKIQRYLNRDFKFQPPQDMLENMTSVLKDVLSTSSKFTSLLPRVEDNCRKYYEKNIENTPNIREPFATMVHNDLWVNNTMLRYENGLAVENIFVDFQCIDYNSPTHDLLFFLYSSVELSIIESNFDDFVKYYFETFIETLKKLDCQIDQFTFQKFTEEMSIIANESQLFHLIFMLQPIYMKKEEAKDLSQMEEVMAATTENSFHENFRKKIIFIISDFEKRGWI